MQGRESAKQRTTSGSDLKERVDTLIKERAPWLYNGKWYVGVIKRSLELLLDYDRTLERGNRYKDLPLDGIMRELEELIARKVEISGLENLPQDGPVLIVANHPTGIGDGIVLEHVFGKVRKDVRYFANGDINRVLPQFEQIVIPVEWRTQKRSMSAMRKTLEAYKSAYDANALCVIFPSGRIAKRRGRWLHEREWMAGAATIARKYKLPVLPVNVQAKNSWLFYLFDFLHPTLRDITLFYELLNKGKEPFKVTIGAPISSESLPRNPDDAIKHLQTATLNLPPEGFALEGLLRVSKTPLDPALERRRGYAGAVPSPSPSQGG